MCVRVCVKVREMRTYKIALLYGSLYEVWDLDRII